MADYGQKRLSLFLKPKKSQRFSFICWYTCTVSAYNVCQFYFFKLEIGTVERGICPIATLYSLAAAYKGVGKCRCKQDAIIFQEGRVVVNFVPKIRCRGNRDRQARNLNDAIE